MTDKVNIVIVDDRPDGLMAIEAVLDSPAYNLLQASSGQEAISHLFQNEVALILLDVQMPVMNGFETARRIKQTEAWKSIPIIFLTAINKEVAHIYQGYECGAVDYLFKPFDPWILKSKVAVFVDIFLKGKKIKEQALQLQEMESSNRYRNLADAIPHIVWKGKLNGSIEYFNQVWNRYTGFSGQSKETNWQRAVDPLDRESFIKRWDESIKTRQPFEIECRLVRYDGASRWHMIRVTFETLSNGTVDSWIGTCTDIHDRKESEEKLEKAREQLEQRVEERTLELSLANEALQMEMSERMKAQKEILEISEREQKRVGQDLHDGLAQHLAGISFKVKSLQQKLNGKLREEEAAAYEILDLLKSGIGETKRVARCFYPIELERNGLCAALMELTIAKEKMFNVVCELRWDPAVKIENRTAGNHLYRIVQESIHNAIRHGKARHIKVSVSPGFDDQITISVQDDGEGISPVPSAPRGMGLRIMEYRAKMLGAHLNIARQKEGGTCVRVSFPSSAGVAEEPQEEFKQQVPAVYRSGERV